MKFSYYNTSSKIILLLICFGPFLGMGVWSIIFAPNLLKLVSIFLFALFGVFFYKCLFINVTLSEQGITYKSMLQQKHLAWSEVKDVLIVVRERRSIPDYYKFDEWIDAGKLGKSYFLLFRTTAGFPENQMFMFSSPIGSDYISVQYRSKIKDTIYKYFYFKK